MLTDEEVMLYWLTGKLADGSKRTTNGTKNGESKTKLFNQSARETAENSETLQGTAPETTGGDAPEKALPLESAYDGYSPANVIFIADDGGVFFGNGDYAPPDSQEKISRDVRGISGWFMEKVPTASGRDGVLAKGKFFYAGEHDGGGDVTPWGDTSDSTSEKSPCGYCESDDFIYGDEDPKPDWPSSYQAEQLLDLATEGLKLLKENNELIRSLSANLLPRTGQEQPYFRKR